MKKIYTAESPIAGLGLFTKESIEVGEVILKFKGDHIFHDYTPEFALEGLNWIGVGKNEWVIPETGSPVLYLNHGCSPNVFINKELELISATAISPDTELHLDYSTTELDPYWFMKCNCGSSDCRKTITCFTSLPIMKQIQYKYYIDPVFWEQTQQLAMNKKGHLYG